MGWEAAFEVEFAEANRCQQHWREYIPGLGSGSGKSEVYFIGKDSWFDALIDNATGVQDQHFLELYTNEESADQAGDHINAWASFDSIALNTALNTLIHEKIGFTFQGAPLLT